MADKGSQQRSSTSLFGHSSSNQSIQEIIRERKEASRARRKWLFSWLLPLVAVIVLGSVGTAGFLAWKEKRDAKLQEERAQAAANDPMRGVTVFGNEDAKLHLEFETADMIMAPPDLLTVVHRAVGIKPFKVRLDTINLQARSGMEDAMNAPTVIRINGKDTVEYLDENGARQTVTLKRPEMTIPKLISAITLAYQETYGDDDPEHPFHIEEPKSAPQRQRKTDAPIDLNIDKMNPKN